MAADFGGVECGDKQEHTCCVVFDHVLGDCLGYDCWCKKVCLPCVGEVIVVHLVEVMLIVGCCVVDDCVYWSTVVDDLLCEGARILGDVSCVCPLG